MKKHFILIGYGDVGMSIARVLEKALVSFVVVDKNEAKFKYKNFKYVVGDATDEEVLKRADLKNATSVIIVLNDGYYFYFADCQNFESALHNHRKGKCHKVH